MSPTTLDAVPVHQGLHANPQMPIRIGLGVIAAFITFLMLWGSVAPLSEAAIAEGSLTVEGRRQVVQHPYGGVVKELFVREGEKVEKGQVLMTLSDSEPRSQLQVLTASRDALLAQEARLTGERDGSDITFGQELLARKDEASVAQAMANEEAVKAARDRQHEVATQALKQRVAQLSEQIAGSNAQLEGIKRQIELMNEEADGARRLLKSGYAPKTRVLALERDSAKLEADRGAKRSEVARAHEARSEAELQIASQDRTRLSDITGELRKTQAQLAEIAPRLEAARDVLNRTRITAPATGAIVGLTVFTEGGVIQSGSKLLEVVPSGNALYAEAKLHLRDISDVTVGRAADVRLVSINRNDRPQLRGEVTTVSADRLTDERTGEGYYSIQVRINPDDITNAGIPLQPGMAAEVVMAAEGRTLVGYLAGPLMDEISGSFREK